jgi:hypothetical protein
VAAAASNHDSLDGRLADQAGFGFAAIDAMLELEKSFFAIGIHVVRDGRTAKSNRFFQDVLHADEKLAELVAGDSRGTAARPNSSTE